MAGKMSVELENEIGLVRVAQSGGTESFEILVNRYEERIYRLIRAVVKNDEDAEDVLQETFLKAYANIHHFNGESRFYTWLVSIAMNETLLKVQHRGVHAWASSGEAASAGEDMSSPGEMRGWHPNGEQTYSQPELSAILSKALEDLETPLRAVFAVRDMEGFSLEETAGILRLPLASVMTRLTQARLKLRESLSVLFEKPSLTVNGRNGRESVRHFLGAALAAERNCS